MDFADLRMHFNRFDVLVNYIEKGSLDSLLKYPDIAGLVQTRQQYNRLLENDSYLATTLVEHRDLVERVFPAIK